MVTGKPNLVIFNPDQWRGDVLGHLGNPATIAEPAKRAQVTAMTGLTRYRDWYGWHEAYSAPFASGNRLFIRTFDFLYCFGDKSQPFTPSKNFEEARE